MSLATENRLGQPHETIVVDHTKILSRSLKKRKSPSHTLLTKEYSSGGKHHQTSCDQIKVNQPVAEVQVDEYPVLNLSIAADI